jgi:hypothetical protein
MFVLFVFLTGAAVAFAFYYLVKAVTGEAPGFDRETLDRLGFLGAFAVYCGSGPVLVVREFERRNAEVAAVSLRHTLLVSCLTIFWTVSLGIVAVESIRYALP